MSNDVITVGSATSTGGKVVSGNSGMVINNKPIALVGDMATCACPNILVCRRQGVIVAMSPRNANVNGVLFARAGDLVDTGCGSCFLLPSEHGVSLGTDVGCSLNVGSGISFGNGVNINQAPAVVSNVVNTLAMLFDRKMIFSEAVKYRIEDANGNVVNQGYSTNGYTGKSNLNKKIKIYVS